ncbi:MAG: ABC transporter ATP-binding protein/permease [Treponema sp.]|jgi:ATP-binding cassette subfamily B protein|nr:ABC transporter ATP-binding protein/permease [Treponema sp.]
MFKLAKYLKPFLPFICLAVAILLVQALCDLNLPNLMSLLVNEILRQEGESRYILRIGLQMLGVALTGGAAAVGVGFLSTWIAAGIARDLRDAVFRKVESFSAREFDAFSTASLITRCTNDVNQIQQIFVMGIRMICYAPIMGLGGIIMAVRKAPAMSWIIVLAVLVLIGMVMIVMSLAMPKFRLIQALTDKLNRTARETLNGIMVIRAFGTQAYERERFDGVNRELSAANLFVHRLMSAQMPAMQLIMNSAILLIIWAGAGYIAASALQVGDMMAFIQYTMQIIFSFLFFSMMFIILPRTAVSADRIAQVLETEVLIRDPAVPKVLPGPFKGRVEFRNVFFRYEGAGENALEGISFTAERGETTALIGATGSGKSTIVNLILRFYDVSVGAVTLDGVDVRELAQEDLRARIAYVPQKSVLFSGSIASNIRYGKRDAADREIREAAELAQAMDFIGENGEGEGLSGFEASLAQGAVNISGGQKQRLSVARALVRNAEILIFDDSFSALDFATDARLRQALREKRREAAKIIVTQRVGTIMGAEKIIVLDKGRIVGTGTHAGLLEECPEYREIAESQFSQEELA